MTALCLPVTASAQCPPCGYYLSTSPELSCGIGGSPALGHDINDAGVVVGHWVCGGATSEVFVWDGTDEGFLTIPRPPGIAGAGAWDTNDAGVIIGTMSPTGLGDRAFVYDGEWVDLETLAGGTFSKGFAVNNLGQGAGVWGNNVVGDPALAAFLWQDAVMTDLNAQLGTPNSEARDINDGGQIVGWMGGAVADAHAFIWHDGVVTALDVIPGGYTSVANAINENGWVAGSGRVRIEEPPFIANRAFIWNGTEMLYLGTLPGFELGAAFDVNERGQVVGRAWSTDANLNAESGFLWQNGVMYDLNDLIPLETGFTLKEARAINDLGQITGSARNETGHVYAVLLTPIDLPGDVDCDCAVGVTDLLALLGSWGPCSDCEHCPADLDGDCVVATSDFLALLGSWALGNGN